MTWTAIALAMTGVAALGMEILWFRHFSILLGGFRAVFSLLLTVILVGIGAGSLLGGVHPAAHRRSRPAGSWSARELLVAATLAGLALADVAGIDAAGHRAGRIVGGVAADGREPRPRNCGSTPSRCCSKSPCRRC